MEQCEISLPSQHLNWNQELLLAIWFCFVFVLGTPLNISVIVLFGRIKRLQTYSNGLIISLAVGDLITCAFLCPLSVVEMLGTPKERCKIEIPAKYLTALMSISGIMLVCIAYYRYKVISKSTCTQLKLSKWKKILLVVFPWISPMFLAISKIVKPSLNDFLVISMIVGVYCGVAIFTHQMKRSLQIKTTLTDVQKERNRKVITLINWILLCSFLSGTIMLVHRVWKLLHKNHNIPLSNDDSALMRYAGRALLATSSTINPFLYFSKHQQFKRAARWFLRKRND